PPPSTLFPYTTLFRSGVEALRRGLMDATSVTTELPAFKHLDLDGFGSFVLGGHDIRRSSFRQAVQEMHDRAGVFESQLIEPCLRSEEHTSELQSQSNL